MTSRVLFAAVLASVAVSASAIEITIRDPRPGTTTTSRETINILGIAEGGRKAVVGGKEVPVYATTSVFVRDGVPLEMGPNRIEVRVEGAGGESATKTIEITRQAAEPEVFVAPADGIDTLSIQPQGDLILRAGEIAEARFIGVPGKVASFRIGSGPWNPMVESADTTGLYMGAAAIAAAADATSQPLMLRLVEPNGPTIAEKEARGRVSIWPAGMFRVAEVQGGSAGLVYGLHDVRLGGPFISEVPGGTRLVVTGKNGGNYRVELSPALTAWVGERAVVLLPEGTPPPRIDLPNMNVEGDDTGDTVTIGRSQPVPFAVNPAVTADGRAAVDVTLYGAHHATTWFVHRQTTGGLVRMIDSTQEETGVVRVRAELHGPVLWGYGVEATTNALVLRIRRTPESVVKGEGLRGLTVAVEAGHGGPRNAGARGISGSEEKEVNRLTAEDTKGILEAAGAKVVMTRVGDEDVNLSERARRAIDGGADLFVSIHANSGGNTRGYLAVGGTSHYYKWLHSRDLAEAIHNRVMEQTGLRNFGLVGNFNYTPIRLITEMPAILVEHAFMSNPEDEAKMLDPAFRKKTATGIRMGIEDFLKSVQAREQGAQQAD